MDRFRFGELVGQLEFKYVETVNDLFGTESCRRLAVDGMTDCFRTLWKMPQAGYTPENEKVILAQGELLSTLLMHLCLKEMNIESVVRRHWNLCGWAATANPMGGSSAAICANICDSTAKCSLFITQGYICRNAAGEIDNLQRGGSDYTASLIGAAVRAEEIQIWTDIDGLHNNDPRIVPNTVRYGCSVSTRHPGWPISVRKSCIRFVSSPPRNTVFRSDCSIRCSRRHPVR